MPTTDWDAPDGEFIVVIDADETVAGGAFRRDETTAELKRIWTSSAHRRRGLARRVLVELEHRPTAGLPPALPRDRAAPARGRKLYLTGG